MTTLEKTLKFEVYPTDAPELMTWTEAAAWAASLGEGWRLPTREELLMMYEQRDRIPGLVTASVSGNALWYWSSTEDRDDPSVVWYVRFSDGVVDWNVKDFFALSSRVVRALAG